ncbi:DUF1353 domain-containing protein [Aquipseudomonas alcaligenes]|uniref:DUF1353 domain-containing protein n=1 Tax=Aquipseudomonas alcaligenes TaxID=43263 RepID=A0AB73HZE1_AQUAC|nr:DUF1353 domain-containing protein [Pseudomonas alcaligenes]MDH0143320.1 DUF1353 domain-containing protein [Pseudomonas alcaligenes]
MKSVGLGVMLLALASGEVFSAEWGEFSEGPDTRWLNDRDMVLLKDFQYVGPDSVVWLAPQGSVVNGASIPRFAWSIIGGPFEGRYRKASVIHDVACDEKSKSWRDTHRAFYNAMLAEGNDPIKSKIMYAAVYHFGPRWGVDRSYWFSSIPARRLDDRINQLQVDAGEGFEVALVNPGERVKVPRGFFWQGDIDQVQGAIVEVRQVQPDYSEVEFNRIKGEIESKELSIEEIEGMSVNDMRVGFEYGE